MTSNQEHRLRVALAQCRLVVGDLAGNAELITGWVKEALAIGAQLVAFPEMTLTGYPPEDLVLRDSFVRAGERALLQLAARLHQEGCGDIAVVVGYLRGTRGRVQNASAVLYEGNVVATSAKVHLPNYGVFDEARYFVPGDSFAVVRVAGVDVGLTICEDLWQAGGPVSAAAHAQIDLLLCINGSPYERGKAAFRTQLCRDSAASAGAPIAYVNQVGGQDELVFDGGSLFVDTEGAVLARAAQFTEELLVCDLDLTVHDSQREGIVDGLRISRSDLGAGFGPPSVPLPRRVAQPLPDLAEVYAAILTGTRDYVDKNGFRSVVLGLSGGIDSALTATVAVDALGADRVHTVALPSAYSSTHSLADAAELARRQGTHHRVMPIAAMVAAYQQALHLTGLAEENLQARVRGTLLMALSNAEGHLVLTTGNKSELATGFSTLYGDSAGGFAPIKDIPKTLVWELARWRNAQDPHAPPIPSESITKPPSAELAPGQLDTDRLPSYDLLDALLDDYVTGDRGRDELIAAGHDPELIDRTVRLVDLAEYKRRQNPPGPKVTSKAFGRDRRLPITNRWREGADEPASPRERPDQDHVDALRDALAGGQTAGSGEQLPVDHRPE
ncbi:MAG TPA: NAD+ synthase [Mycobacteriales bacterium]|nr:NAD+ synthase [Mycobacteriales bacterium]